MKDNIRYILYFVLGLVLILIVQSLIPKPVDWNPTFNTNDKIPYGLYVLDKELPELIQPAKMSIYNRTPYEYLEKPDKKAKTLLFIDDIVQPDPNSVHRILDAVKEGSDVFIFANKWSKTLLDTLDIEVFSYGRDNSVQLLNSNLTSYRFEMKEESNYFVVNDSMNVTVLGHIDKQNNYLRKKIGKGNLYLHCNAFLLTNFYLLESNSHLYAEGALSYIDRNKELIWFYSKESENVINSSPMRFVLENDALRWAWYFLIFGTLIFILFNIKRKQRIIPIITPEENKSVEFAKTISNLYYLEKNHTDMMQKMIIYFLDYVRTQLRIDTSKLDERFVELLHLKAGKNKEEVQELVDLIKRYRSTTEKVSEKTLIQLHEKIDKITKS